MFIICASFEKSLEKQVVEIKSISESSFNFFLFNAIIVKETLLGQIQSRIA